MYSVQVWDVVESKANRRNARRKCPEGTINKRLEVIVRETGVFLLYQDWSDLSGTQIHVWTMGLTC